MNRLSVFAVTFGVALLSLTPAPFADDTTRTTCGEMNRDMVFFATEIRSLEETLRKNAGQVHRYDGLLTHYQNQRRQIGCVGNRTLARRALEECHRLNDAYVGTQRDKVALQTEMGALLQQQERLQRKLANTRFTHKARCACWKPGEPHTGMTGRNIAGFAAEDLDDCKVACNKAERCKSIDFNPKTNACYLNDLDRSSRSPTPSFTSRPNWPFTYHERC